MARRSSQREDLPRSMRGFAQEISQGRYFDYHQNGTRALTVRPPQTPVLNSIPHPIQYQSPCIGLFGYLRHIDWYHLRFYSPSPSPSPFVEMFQYASGPVPDILGLPLWQRQLYLEASRQSQPMQHPSASMSGVAARQESVNRLVTQAQRQYPHLVAAYTLEELQREFDSHVRYGSYWNEFRIVLQSNEVLLIDPSYCFDSDNSTTTFESARSLWLCDVLGLRQFCQKLSGLTQMISNLAGTDMHSEARAYLASKIIDRLEEVLGPRPVPPSATLPSCPASPTSPYPTFGLESSSSPLEMMDADPYSSLSEFIGTGGTGDGYAQLDGRVYSSALDSPYLNEHIWSN